MKRLQYTIRQVPPLLDRQLRKRARREGKSINVVAVEAMARGLGLHDSPQVHHDMDDLIGTWVKDPLFDKALADMDRVDPELWK